ncbi:SCO family protein [Tateyamaria sp. SN3-11]|uniref:SCO family protein n=1 Tax=Tateyamaria sp. SN3-11 TaxID=3092147 RepID=UPI0039EBD121
MTRIIAPVAALVAALFIGGIWWATQGGGEDTAFGQCQATQIAGDGNQIGGPFELVNAAGETVTDQDVITEPTLIYFGYTFCPDVCPLDTARNAEAVDVLAERGMSVTPVFITIDPERDTPELVGDFAYNLHEKMIGLTGSLEQTDAASKAYRTYYKAHDKSDEFYLVDHSTFTYLVMPEHGFVEFFRRDVSAEAMADRVGCFVENA